MPATDASCLPGPLLTSPFSSMSSNHAPYGRVRNPILRSIPGRKKCDTRLARALRDRCIMSPPPPLTPHFNVVVSFIVTSRSAVALRRHCSTQFNIEMGGEGGAGVGHMAFRSETIRVALFPPRYGPRYCVNCLKTSFKKRRCDAEVISLVTV